MAFKITSLSAFIAVGDNGNEGVIARKFDGMWMPLIAADETRLLSLRVLAEEWKADNPGKEVKLVRFSHREDLE